MNFNYFNENVSWTPLGDSTGLKTSCWKLCNLWMAFIIRISNVTERKKVVTANNLSFGFTQFKADRNKLSCSI